jgi:hypothetical protein
MNSVDCLKCDRDMVRLLRQAESVLRQGVAEYRQENRSVREGKWDWIVEENKQLLGID